MSPFTAIGGIMPRGLFFFPISQERTPAINVASDPPIMSTGPRLFGLMRFAMKHPSVTPGMVAAEKIGRIVKTSAILTWIGPYAMFAKGAGRH